MVYITVRRVLGEQMVVDPATNLMAPIAVLAEATAPRRSTVAVKPRVGGKRSVRAARAARPAPSASELLAKRRISSRLAAKHEDGASGSTSFCSPSISINSMDNEVAGILGAMDDEVVSGGPTPRLDTLALLANEGEAAATTSVLEDLSPLERDGLVTPRAPKSSDSSYVTAVSVLGKRKAEEEGEVDSDNAAASVAALERAYEAQQFDTAILDAENILAKFVAARVAREKKTKKMKLSHVAPAVAVAVAANANGAAPAAGLGVVPSAAPIKSRKGGKNRPVARKVATKKASVGINANTTTAAAAKKRVDPCFPTAMEVDHVASSAEVLGSMDAAGGVRKSRRIGNRVAAVSAAKSAAKQPSHRRKQAVPALAAL